MAITLKVNGTTHSLDIEPEMPLLWALRDELGLTGTKFGCGVAACGACTVHVDGVATRTCVTPVEAVDGARSPPSRASPPRQARRRACLPPSSRPGSTRRFPNAAIASPAC